MLNIKTLLSISRCQESLLDHMIIQDNIARNKALRENIFMMFVCVELRIPLFLVGKPGSSKSLAKTIIQSSMKGENSKTPKMQEFKQVSTRAYHGHSLLHPVLYHFRSTCTLINVAQCPHHPVLLRFLA